MRQIFELVVPLAIVVAVSTGPGCSSSSSSGNATGQDSGTMSMPDSGTGEDATMTPDTGTDATGTEDTGTGVVDTGVIDATWKDTGANDAGVEACTPATCGDQGFDCGMATDGCGTQINCGTCNQGETCAANHCGGSDGGID